MKKLNQFTLFDWDSFCEGKRFMSIGKQEWKDYATGETVGTKIEAVITQDNTKYDVAEGEIASNLYEKLTFKIPHTIDIPMNVEIHPQKVTATVYGEYRNQLSLYAEDILVVKK